MPDIFYLISKWWKQVLLLVLLSMLVTGASVFLQPSRYLSVSTAVRASIELSDKARIFNKNIEYLYPSLGNSDDLDIILGTAELDTIYLSVATSFTLWDHYKIKKSRKDIVYEAAAALKKNTDIIRSDYGELKVKVWDEDKNLAPQLANALMDQLNAIHRELQNANNQATLYSLLAGRKKLERRIDSADDQIRNAASAKGTLVQETRLRSLADQLLEYEKLADEYQAVIDARPNALVIVEKARPAVHADKPRRLMILAATAFLSFCFALVVILVMERRKKGLA